METQIVKYDINTAAIAKMAEIYMDLTISNLEDKEQFDAVHSARMVVRGHRITLDKAVKGYNDQANTFKKSVKAEAKPLYDGIEPIESHLVAQEKKVTDEQDRIKAEEAAKEKAKIQARIDELQKYGQVMSFFDIAALNEDEYDTILDNAIVAHLAEQGRLETERLEREAERKKNEEIMLESERRQKAQDERDRIAQEKQDRLEAENAAKVAASELAEAEAQERIDAAIAEIEADRKALEDEKKAEADRIAMTLFKEKAAKDAKERAEHDATVKAEREEREAKEKEEADRIEKDRQEVLRPDKDRLEDYANDLMMLKWPDLQSDEGKNILTWAKNELLLLSNEIIAKLKKL